MAEYIDPYDTDTSVEVYVNGNKVKSVCKIDIDVDKAVLECLTPAPTIEKTLSITMKDKGDVVFEVKRKIVKAYPIGAKCCVDSVCRLRYLIALEK